MAEYQFHGKTHRQVVSEKLMYYYDLYAPFYRTLVVRYLEEFERRKRLRVRRSSINPETTITHFPQIQFFEIEDRNEAKNHLAALKKVELDYLIHDIKETISSRSFKRLVNEYYDMDYTNSRAERKRCQSHD